MDINKDTGTDTSLDTDTGLEIISAEEAVEAAKGMTFEVVWNALMEYRRQMAEDARMREEERQKQSEAWQKQNEEWQKREEERQKREEERQKREEERQKREEERQKRSEEERQKRSEEERQKREEEQKKQDEKRQKDMDKFRREMQKSTDEMKRQLGGIGNTLGEFSESMFSPALWKKFAEYGIEVTEQSERKQFNANGKRVAEADVYIENGEYAIPVEIKTKLTEAHVDDHIERLKIISAHLNSKGDKRKLLGAVAGGVVADKVRSYAQAKGLFVIVQSGNCATIAELPEGFKAREW